MICAHWPLPNQTIFLSNSLPPATPQGIDETCTLCQRGYTPILAHVERYPFVTEDPTLVAQLGQRGLSGVDQRQRPGAEGRTAHWLPKLLEWNPVHLLWHRLPLIDARPPNLKAGYSKLPPIARRLRRNSIEVHLGNELVPPEPTKPQYCFWLLGVTLLLTTPPADEFAGGYFVYEPMTSAMAGPTWP